MESHGEDSSDQTLVLLCQRWNLIQLERRNLWSNEDLPRMLNTREKKEIKKENSMIMFFLHFDRIRNSLCPLNQTSRREDEEYNSTRVYRHKLIHVRQV